MNLLQRISIFVLLPVIAFLLITPEFFTSTFVYWFVPAAILLPFLSIFLFQGRSAALTLLIFLVGFNLIMRIMMFFPHFANSDGSVDLLFVVTSLASIALSTYLLLRLDRIDVRGQMVR